MTPEDEVWARVLRRLVPWTVKRHGVTATNAEDIVQEGIAQLIRSGKCIDLKDFEELLRTVGSRINGVAVNLRRKKALRNVLLAEDVSFEELSEENEVENRFIGDDIARRAVNAILDRIDGDEVVFSILGLMEEGVYEPAEQAKRLDRGINDIYNARRRLAEHSKAVRKLMESW